MNAPKTKATKQPLRDPISGEPDEHVLDPTTQSYLAELQNHVNTVTASVTASMKVALELEIRRAGLPGNWQISPDGKKLIRVADQPTAETPTN